MFQSPPPIFARYGPSGKRIGSMPFADFPRLNEIFVLCAWPILFAASMSLNENGGGIAARLARSNILELSPYRCARDDYSEGILLDANENAFGPPVDYRDLYVLERYPDPYQIPLKEKLAAYRGHGLKPENIFVGVGSDEAIDLLMRIFCRPGIDKILTTPPTYGMYKVCAKVNDVEIVNVPLTPYFDVRIPEVRKVGRLPHATL